MPVIFTHTQSHTHTHSNHPHSPEHTHVKHNTQLYNIKLQQFILRANHVNFNQHATDNHNHAPLIHTASQQTDNTLSHHKTDCATSIDNSRRMRGNPCSSGPCSQLNCFVIFRIRGGREGGGGLKIFVEK